MRIRMYMAFVWDKVKAKNNLAKHRISFVKAIEVFDDPHQLTIPDDYEFEERWQTMGLVRGIVIVVVVHTVEEDLDEETIRVISARKATRRESEAYEGNRKE